MNMSNDLITEFAKELSSKPEQKKESLVNGTAIKVGDTVYAKIDGSSMWTPVATTAIIKSEDEANGERVTILVKDHSATIVGNTSTPAARSDDVDTMGMQIHELDIVTAYRVNADDITAVRATITELKTISAKHQEMSAVTAQIEELTAKLIDTEYISAKNMDVIVAEIEQLKASFGEFGEIIADDAEFVEAQIGILNGHTANFNYVSTNSLKAMKAAIVELDVNKLSAEEANLKYVNIDFANIDEAWMNEFYSKSGLIQFITSEDLTVSGQLVGVTIKGDLIEAGTLVADKLVVKGTDGLYYKLNTDGATTEAEQTEYNSLNGKVIAAKSITADKISVSDLVAFGADIGGFHISDNAIYSGVKNSIENTTRGIYFDTEGEFSFGDNLNFIKYYKDVDEEGNEVYRLAISAESIVFDPTDSTANLKARMDKIKMGTYTDPVTGEIQPYIELAGQDSAEGDPSVFKLRLTNKQATFSDDGSPTIIDSNGVDTENVNVRGELRQGPLAWTTRKSGKYTHYGLMWKGVTS